MLPSPLTLKRTMKRLYAALLLFALGLVACDSVLEEDVYSQLSPSNFFQTEQDAEAMLNAAYVVEQNFGSRNYFLLGELPTDLMIERGGGLRRLAQPLEDFTWDASHPFLNGLWGQLYTAIYRSNLILDRVPEIDFDEARKTELLAEARFIRAESYMELYDLFGPTPLVTSSEVDPESEPARATEEEMVAFIGEELRAAAADLPDVAAEYGRATRGAALALLARFHLNNRAWQLALDAAREVDAMDRYALFQGESRSDLFRVENERNAEFIHVRPYVTGLRGNAYLAHAAPPGYQFKAPPKTNFAAQYQTLSSFLDSFHPDDQRRGSFITEYENVDGEMVQLGEDNARSFKYKEDLLATGTDLGNDIPAIRYADILLIQAEALNELNGPTQEAVDLINRVREVAGAPPLSLADVPSPEALREAILAERGWEFFTEGLRRQDLIRHGVFIERAQQRGKNAKPFHRRYPLPQDELDKNPNLEQNEGYQ